MEEQLRKSVIGQDEAITAMQFTAHTGMQDINRRFYFLALPALVKLN